MAAGGRQAAGKRGCVKELERHKTRWKGRDYIKLVTCGGHLRHVCPCFPGRRVKVCRAMPSKRAGRSLDLGVDVLDALAQLHQEEHLRASEDCVQDSKWAWLQLGSCIRHKSG